MTPREITIRNLELSGPERIGIAYGAGLVNDHCGGTIDMGTLQLSAQRNGTATPPPELEHSLP